MAHALRRLACAAAVTLAVTGHAHAQGPATRDGWQFAISPYLWIAGISGTIDTPFQRIPRQDVSADFGDILSNLSGYAFMGAAEIRYGRFALLGDLMTLSVESDVDTPRDRLFAGGTGRVTTTIGPSSAWCASWMTAPTCWTSGRACGPGGSRPGCR